MLHNIQPVVELGPEMGGTTDKSGVPRRTMEDQNQTFEDISAARTTARPQLLGGTERTRTQR